MKSNEKNEQDITKQIEEKSISESEARKYLSIAFSNEDVNLIKLIINHYPELVNQVLIFDYYPLHEIAFIENMSNRHEAVNLLLDKGADVNIQTGIRNNTPLTMVFGRKQIETFYLLLSKGANKNITLGLSVPYIQYIVDECFDEIQLDKDNKTILQNTKKSYEFKFYNYDQLLKMFDWYHSLSEKYKDKEYKNKFHTFFEKAKKEAIEYMLILQDILLNHYFQDEANPKSMLMIKHEKLGEQQRVELTNKEINQLEDSIINFLSVQKIGMYYIPLIMTKNNEKGLALKELVLSSENYLLPRELQRKINITMKLYDNNKKDYLIKFVHRALDKENEIEELKQKLIDLSKENADLKNKLLQEDTTPQYKYIIVMDDVTALEHLNSNNEENGVKITGYEIEYFA